MTTTQNQPLSESTPIEGRYGRSSQLFLFGAVAIAVTWGLVLTVISIL